MIVNGKNVSLLIYDNGQYRLYACATSCSISIGTSTVETSTLGSGSWASFMPQKHSWNGSLNGVVNLDEDGQLSLYDLRALQIAKTKLVIQFQYIDEAGNEYDENGECYIVNSTANGDVNNISTFSIEIQGTGALGQLLTIPEYLLINSNDILLINSSDKFIL